MTLNKSEAEKRINEFQSTFLSMKEDEPHKINIKSNELFENETRNNMIKWLSFLCNTLNFNSQTLIRSTIIFDKFLASSPICNLDDGELTQEKLNLITIACLSLGTKLEEINCNYVSFFTEKVLNLPNCQIFTVKDLTKMELTILKELNYKTLYTTSYDFILFYLDIFKYFFNPNFQFIHNLKIFAENIMKQNINTNIFVNMTQSDYALTCLNQAFAQFGLDNIMNQIRNILMIFNINNLIKKNKSLNINNSDNENNNDDNLHHNLEVNLLSLPSF
jgi:hypothetical protein